MCVGGRLGRSSTATESSRGSDNTNRAGRADGALHMCKHLYCTSAVVLLRRRRYLSQLSS